LTNVLDAATPPTTKPGQDAENASRGRHDPEKLRRYLNAYWLRPENALWMTLRSDALERVSFATPAIDVACGDGIHTFLHLGGAFDPDFDVFEAVGSLDRVRDGHADMFDVPAASYAPTIVTKPRMRIDTGLDLKPNLLSKAARLGLYERLTPHDGNERIPLPTDSFRTVHCNAAYWVRNVNGLLAELARITQPNGRVVLQVKLDTIQACTFESLRETLGDRFLDILGRGRFATWPALASRDVWERRFERAGLEMTDLQPFITAAHARMWDVGLRPLAPLLVRMANALSPETRSSIKRDWVDLFNELLAPLRRFDLSLSTVPGTPVEIQYVLKPR